jgi:copper chaperone CopZ
MGATARRISQSLIVLGCLVAPGFARAEVRRLAFPVSGMHSPLATRGVEEAIRQLPGVASVRADLGTGRVEVEAESLKSLNLQEVRTRSARAGFPVSGDLDILARGRFETGVDGRITFKVTGTTYAWQVLESGTLLEIARSHPGLRGEFIAGFRLFEKPVWNHPAISLTGWEAVPPPGPAAQPPTAKAPPAAKPPRPTAGGKSAAPATKPAAKGKTVAATKPAVAKSGGSKPAVVAKKRKDRQDPEKP